MDGYKHYIRVNEAGIVIYGFSDAFEQPQAGDLPLSGDQGRHFQIQLTNERMQYIYKLENGAMVARTQQELDVEWNSRPSPPPTEIELLREENKQLNLSIIEVWENIIPLLL